MAKRILERSLLAVRWLLIPFYFALAFGILGLLAKAVQRIFELAVDFQGLSEEGMILGILAIVVLAVMGAMIVVMIFSSYANFISRQDVRKRKDWPRGMAGVSFERLKFKIMMCIVAISAIKLLVSFMEVAQVSDRDLYFQIGIHSAFVLSILLLVLSDRMKFFFGAGSKVDREASHD